MLNKDESDGFLIDLDLAIKLENIVASGAPSKTGTRIFMAIGALKGEEHNFMHDLESFFWVLLWMCVHWNGPDKEDTKSTLENWNFMNSTELIRNKTSIVEEECFLQILTEFTSHCTEMEKCVKKIHGIVFPNHSKWKSLNRNVYSDMQRELENAADEFQ